MNSEVEPVKAVSAIASKLPVASYEQVVASLFVLGWSASVVVAGHTRFFFVDPFRSNETLRSIELVLFIAGWVLMCLGPIAIAVRMLLVGDAELRYLRIVALLYPVSVLLIQVTLWQQSQHFQKPYSYIGSNKWFIVTDIAVPLGLFLLDLVVRKSRDVSEFAPESEKASS